MGKWRIESAGARPTASENEEGNFLRAGTINRSLRWSCKMPSGAVESTRNWNAGTG
jgi:hypothetical protein